MRGFHIFSENNFAQSCDSGGIKFSEYLNHGLYHHMVMKKAEVRYFHQLLPYRHLADGARAENQYKVHKFASL